MDRNTQPTRVQFQIGKSAPIKLQQWVENQSLPINKAVREVLNHFVYLYGTEDILSNEIREKMSLQQNTITSPTDHEQETNEKPSNRNGVIANEPVEDGATTAAKKVITERDIDI